MKKLILAGAMVMFLLPVLVLAQECDTDINTQINLPQISTSFESYYNRQTGDGLYLYCVWGLDKGSSNVEGDYTSMTTGDCPVTVQPYTFTQTGTYDYNAMIVGLPIINGVPETAYIVDSVNAHYNVCYSMPEPMSLWDRIIEFLCKSFPWLWFCPGGHSPWTP